MRSVRFLRELNNLVSDLGNHRRGGARLFLESCMNIAVSLVSFGNGLRITGHYIEALLTSIKLRVHTSVHGQSRQCL